MGIFLAFATPTFAQLDENCVVSILNRTAQVQPDGSFILPNIPSNMGQVRARATCVSNGTTTSGGSDFFSFQPTSTAVRVPQITFGNNDPIPSMLTVSAPATVLGAAGAAVQLAVIATFPDGSSADFTQESAGTNYVVSNPAIATVSPNGLVTAVSSGTVVVSAMSEGALGLIRIQVVLSGDSDGDGLPDDLELANGLNPNDPVDAEEDPDRDGLTNRDELLTYGTNIRLVDTDGDGLSDGDEVLRYGTDPLLADTDGDGTNDGRELQCGSDPKNASDRGRKLVSIEVNPPVFTIHANTVLLSEAYWQLAVTGHLANNCGTVDLTPIAQGTNYASSDLTTCNFGPEDGRVFAGPDGTCTITATNSGLSAVANGMVTTFAPTALTFINIPGTTNNVDVNGNFAYVAAGSAGLQVVDVSNHSAPVIAGSVDTPGSANDVVVVGSTALVADGPSGLQIIDITDPHKPLLRSSIDTPGDAQDVVVKGNLAFVADGASGLQVIDVSNLDAPVILGAVDTPGAGWGVDATPDGLLAVVADGTSGLQIVNTADPRHPAIIGTLPGGDARDVAVRGNFAFVADYSRSFTSVDISDPSHPVLKASTDRSLGGLLTDVALAGRFALAADVFFVNGVPIIDVSTPAAPVPPAILDFRSFGDDNGTGIAADSSYVYLTTDRNRLFIGQYLAVEDRNGIPPTARITTPVPGSTAIEGSTIPVTVDASDDIAVAAVNLMVNGIVVSTDTAAPYQFSFTVPVGVSSLTLGATAIDLGGNVGAAQDVEINVIPDPGTTVVGKAVFADGSPAPGATVTTVGSRSSTTATDGSFSIGQVPTVLGNIVVRVRFVAADGTFFEGSSSPAPPVPFGITNVTNAAIPQVTFTEYPVPTTGTFPRAITTGSDGNLWFTGDNIPSIGRITTAGVVTEFSVRADEGIAAGPDGNLWFTEYFGQKVGRITTTGVITEFSLPNGSSYPFGITAGPDGNLWFAERFGNTIGRITTAGVITEFAVPTSGSNPVLITAGPDGNLWFTELEGNKIGRITTAGVITEFSIPTSNSAPYGITTGPDGNLWFAETRGNKIGRIFTAGVITEYPVPTGGSQPAYITVGPDGNMWFTEDLASQIATITTAGVITEFPVPTPASRPQGITTGPDGNLWFAEGNANQIVRVNIAPRSDAIIIVPTPFQFNVDGVLPSSQGATYVHSGSVSESSVFSVSGGLLHQDTLGTGEGAGYISGIVFNHHLDAVLEWRAKVSHTTGPAGVEIELVDSDPANLRYWDFDLLDDRIQGTNGKGVLYEFALLDTTDAFHTYKLVVPADSDSYQLFVDGSLKFSGTAYVDLGVTTHPYKGQFFWGDGTGPNDGKLDWDYIRLTNATHYSVCLLYDSTNGQKRDVATIRAISPLCL